MKFFRKITSAFVTLALVICMVPTMIQVSAESSYTTIFEDFESASNDNTIYKVMEGDGGTFSGPECAKTEIISDNAISGGKSLKITVTQKIKYAALVCQPENMIFDEDGRDYEGIVLRIRTESKATGIPQVRFSLYGETVNSIILGNKSKVVSNIGQDKTLGPEGIPIPSNFEGVVFLPFKPYESGWQKGELNKENLKDPFSLEIMLIQYAGQGWDAGDSLTVDNIALYKKGDERQVLLDLGVDLPPVDPTPFYDDETGVGIEIFNSTALPKDTFLFAPTKEITSTEEKAVLKSDTKARIYSLYDTYFADITGGGYNDIFLRDVVMISFPAPKFVNPEDVKVFVIKNGTTSTQVPIESIENGKVNCYIRSVGEFAITVPGSPRFTDTSEEETDNTPPSTGGTTDSTTGDTGTPSVDIDLDLDFDLGENNSSGILSEITNKDVNDAIASAVDDLVVFRCYNNCLLTSEQLEVLKNSNKKVDIYVYDESDQVILVWKFASITNYDIDFYLGIETKNQYEDKILNLVNNNKNFISSFIHKGQLPGKAQIVIPNKQGFKLSEKVNIFVYNSDTNAIEKTEAMIALTNDEEYIVLITDTCSDYVVTTYSIPTEETENQEEISTDNQMWVIILIIVISLVVIAGAVIVTMMIIKKNKKGE